MLICNKWIPMYELLNYSQSTYDDVDVVIKT